MQNETLESNRVITTLTEKSLLDEMVNDFIKTVIIENIVPPYIEWARVGKNQIHSRTAENYIHLLRRHFLECFTGWTISAITTRELQVHFNRLAQTHSNSVIIKVHFLVNRMFRRAQNKWGLGNPLDTDDFKVPVSLKKDMKAEPYNNDEMFKILLGVNAHPTLKPIVNLLAATGCRTQEILNLRWQHIDFINGSVKIERAMTIDVEFDDLGNTIRKKTVDGRTKRKSSERTLYVDEYTLDLIREWQKHAIIHTKTKFGKYDYVFGNTRSDHYTYCGFRSVLNRHFDIKYGKGHGLAALHRIRHTVATKAAEEGASIIELMQLLGDNQERSVLRYTGRSTTIAIKNRDRISKSMMAVRNYKCRSEA